MLESSLRENMPKPNVLEGRKEAHWTRLQPVIFSMPWPQVGQRIILLAAWYSLKPLSASASPTCQLWQLISLENLVVSSSRWIFTGDSCHQGNRLCSLCEVHFAGSQVSTPKSAVQTIIKSGTLGVLAKGGLQSRHTWRWYSSQLRL
jgi:hypothetical protein